MVFCSWCAPAGNSPSTPWEQTNPKQSKSLVSSWTTLPQAFSPWEHYVSSSLCLDALSFNLCMVALCHSGLSWNATSLEKPCFITFYPCLSFWIAFNTRWYVMTVTLPNSKPHQSQGQPVLQQRVTWMYWGFQVALKGFIKDTTTSIFFFLLILKPDPSGRKMSILYPRWSHLGLKKQHNLPKIT
jgi:hypothetical protein